MKSQFRFHEVDFGRLFYGISPCFVSGSFFFSNIQEFSKLSLGEPVPLEPGSAL